MVRGRNARQRGELTNAAEDLLGIGRMPLDGFPCVAELKDLGSSVFGQAQFAAGVHADPIQYRLRTVPDSRQAIEHVHELRCQRRIEQVWRPAVM
jgi:hypothetical protein